MFCKHILAYFYTTLNQSYCERGSSRMYKKDVHQLVRNVLVTYWLLDIEFYCGGLLWEYSLF